MNLLMNLDYKVLLFWGIIFIILLLGKEAILKTLTALEQIEEAKDLSLKIGQRIETNMSYEVVEHFFCKDNKYALLVSKVDNRFTNNYTILQVGQVKIIEDKDVFSRAVVVFNEFKTNNKDKFLGV